MRAVKSVLVVATAFICVVQAQAQPVESLGNRRIQSVGCHHSDNTCFVTLDGAAFGATLGCSITSTTEFRFDNADTSGGRRTHAAMFAAHMANRSVAVAVAGCSRQGYPSVAWWYVL